ncbi:hypothetical protein Acr_08g0011510 [Actinidia rufa]|uniref:Uncharacterized protein n=1 Tax=Actinidia rufa TaxID=165716 RepID=A0A7J0F230_9ERIC|nr:hypothetical protein Acr_08g0011510 [Actinidia rufa]
MSKRIDMQKLAQIAKRGGSKHSTPVGEGMVISEKRPRDEISDILPTKKVKSIADSIGKGTMSPLEAKNKFKETRSKMESKGARPTVLGDVLWLTTSVLDNLAVAEMLLEGMIPSFDKEEVGKLLLEAFPWSRSSGGACFFLRRTWQGVEGGGDDLVVLEQQDLEDHRKMKEDQDATVERLEKEVAKLKKKEVLAKKLAIHEYKSLDDFQEEGEWGFAHRNSARRVSANSPISVDGFWMNVFDQSCDDFGNLGHQLIENDEIDPPLLE